MEQLPRLKARIESLKELQGLMSAMRVLAASHVQEAQAALNGIREYVQIIEDAIAEGVSLLPDNGVTAPRGSPVEDVLILICSEHGFVGGFNDRLIERAIEELSDHRQLAVVGSRGAELTTEQGHSVAWSEAMATRTTGTPGVARRVARQLAGVSRAELIYGAYRRGGRYEIEKRRILPLDPALLTRVDSRYPPLHHLAGEVLLQRLADEYLLAELSRAIMESLASENAARLQVMESADRNIDSRLQRLKGQSLALRQETITAELLDLMTGAEAILGASQPNPWGQSKGSRS